MSRRGVHDPFDRARQHARGNVVAFGIGLALGRRDYRPVAAQILRLELILRRAGGKRHFVDQDAMQFLIDAVGGDDAIDKLGRPLFHRDR